MSAVRGTFEGMSPFDKRCLSPDGLILKMEKVVKLALFVRVLQRPLVNDEALECIAHVISLV